MQSSEEKVKKKINMLIDRISNLKNDVGSQVSQIQSLEKEIEEIRILQQKGQNFDAEKKIVNLESENKMSSFMMDFCRISRLLVENMDYIEYSYKTKNSEDFYKIEQGVFEDYVCQYAQMDLKTFINFCIDLGLVKSEKNRRCIYNSAEIRVYYVNKLFVDTAAKKEELQEV